jgi:hypothetical protein
LYFCILNNKKNELIYYIFFIIVKNMELVCEIELYRPSMNTLGEYCDKIPIFQGGQMQLWYTKR